MNSEKNTSYLVLKKFNIIFKTSIYIIMVLIARFYTGKQEM